MALAAEPGETFPLRNAGEGQKAPAFSIKPARGAGWSSSLPAGKPMVVCYFRRGHKFSMRSLEALARLAPRFAAQGVVFVGVYAAGDDGAVFDVERSTALAFAEDADRALYGSWGLFVLPTTVVLGKETRILAAFASDQGDLAEKVAGVLDDALGVARKPSGATLPKSPGADPSIGLARQFLMNGKAREALELLAPALAAANAGCAERLLASRAHLAMKAPAEAKREAEACLAKEPLSPQGALAAGLADEVLGNLAAAEERLKFAASLMPNSAEARLHLGGLYERSGRTEEALAEYRTALERVLRE
jgi:hypothetical protein